MKAYKLSILTPTLNSRSEKLHALWAELQYQMQSKPVQLLSLGDNKSMTVGEKRNHLMDMAKGDYFCFIDDDDSVSSDFIEEVLQAVETGKPIITFNGTQNTNGKQDLPFTYDINIGRNMKRDGWKVMLPDHLCIWKNSEVTYKFPHKNISEDHEWAKKICADFKESDVHHIDKFLYHYEFNKDESECRR